MVAETWRRVSADRVGLRAAGARRCGRGSGGDRVWRAGGGGRCECRAGGRAAFCDSKTPLPAARPAIRVAADSITPDARAGDSRRRWIWGRGSTHSRAAEMPAVRSRVCDGFKQGAPGRLPAKKAKRRRPSLSGTGRSFGWSATGGCCWCGGRTRVCSAGCARFRPGLGVMLRPVSGQLRRRRIGGCWTRPWRTDLHFDLATDACGDGRGRISPAFQRQANGGRSTSWIPPASRPFFAKARQDHTELHETGALDFDGRTCHIGCRRNLYLTERNRVHKMSPQARPTPRMTIPVNALLPATSALCRRLYVAQGQMPGIVGAFGAGDGRRCSRRRARSATPPMLRRRAPDSLWRVYSMSSRSRDVGDDAGRGQQEAQPRRSGQQASRRSGHEGRDQLIRRSPRARRRGYHDPQSADAHRGGSGFTRSSPRGRCSRNMSGSASAVGQCGDGRRRCGPCGRSRWREFANRVATLPLIADPRRKWSYSIGL